MNKKTIFLTILIIIIILFSSSYFYLKSNKEKTNVTNIYIITYDAQKGNLKKIKSELNRLGVVIIKKYYKGVFPAIEIKTTKDMMNDVRGIEGVTSIEEKEDDLGIKIPEDI
ncbi:hypothetical protein [Bacillus thuringiensis]|uniref:hypothetical protein n=1 Tax=Bacillus thuringiensis TaxID=1428 RepID=UPI0021D66606|nr:hypothetical protein [Bacillus thuringiensis]MCU7667899.1 hypothetical protein [Bacillus thuringiensis]